MGPIPSSLSFPIGEPIPPRPQGSVLRFFSLRGDSEVLCSALLSQHRLGRLRFLGSAGDSSGRKGVVGE